MQKQSSSETQPHSVLSSTVPVDVGAQSQRQRIIDAMIASCAEKTYATTTISDVVSGASISRTTFYKRFPDKRACFDAALDHCVAEVQAVAAETVDAGDSPPEAIRKISAAVLGLLAAKPALASLLAADAVAVDPAVTSRYGALLIPALEGLWKERPPTLESPAGMSPGLAFGRAQLLIFGQVAAGRVEQLPELHPEVVYLALAPFAGHREAVRQARLATEEASADRSVGV